MKTERMVKLRIISASTQLENFIQKLHSLGVMHIIPHLKNVDMDIGNSLETIEKISELLVTLRSIIGKFGVHETASKTVYTINEIEHTLSSLSTQIKEYEEQILHLSREASEKNELLHQLDFLNSLYLDLDSYQPLQSITQFVGYIKHRDDLRDRLEKITQSFKLHISKNGKNRTIALFCKNDDAEKISELLKVYSYTEAHIDKALTLKGSVMTNINKTIDQISTIEIDIHKTKNHLTHLVNKHKQFIVNAELFLSTEADKAEVPLQFGKTEGSFVVSGWIPEQDADTIKTHIEKATHSKVCIEEQHIEKKDKVPIKLKHTILVKPFQFFLDLYTLPKYSELDPTLFMFFTFPLFFGIMLGDVGYGIITLLFFLWLKSKAPSLKRLLNIMMYSSVSTIFFGLIFGEYFGFEYVKEKTASFLALLGISLHSETIMYHGNQLIVYEFPRLFNRLHGHVDVMGNEIHAILVAGAIIGFLHLNIALFLGFINELQEHSFVHAFLHKLSWIVLESAVILLAISVAGVAGIPLLFGWIVLAVAIIMIYLGEGVQGLVELPAIFSNMLSYMRLGAVGLASVGLAVVINENLTLPFIEKGGIYTFFGILIFIIGHIINILLGLIGPFLHSLRLHYVEFFSKFYKGGGIQYVPFGAKNTMEGE